MKAALCERYGPPEVLRIADIDKPAIKDNQVLIHVVNATVTLGDCECRSFKMANWIWIPARIAFGILKPRNPVLGMEVAGEIVETGKDVTRFKPGDRIFGSTSFSMGAYAQFKALGENAPIIPIPEGVSYAEAAGIPTGGLNGLHFVRHAGINAGETVLINGAGGSIGSFALQFAKRVGAEVTAVDRGDKLDMLRNLGADDVIDYKSQDFTALGRQWDVIIDVVGVAPFKGAMNSLTDTGRFFLGNPKFTQMMQGLFASKKDGKRVLFKLAGESRDDLTEIAALVASGDIKVPIDRHFPLEEIAAAHRYVEAGDKKGIVVIDMPQEG